MFILYKRFQLYDVCVVELVVVLRFMYFIFHIERDIKTFIFDFLYSNFLIKALKTFISFFSSSISSI